MSDMKYKAGDIVRDRVTEDEWEVVSIINYYILGKREVFAEHELMSEQEWDTLNKRKENARESFKKAWKLSEDLGLDDRGRVCGSGYFEEEN